MDIRLVAEELHNEAKNARIINMGSSQNFYRNNSQFVKLMFANALGRFGDSIDMVAFSWLTYQITNSVAWSAVVVGVNQLVSVFYHSCLYLSVFYFAVKNLKINHSLADRESIGNKRNEKCKICGSIGT